MGYDATQPPPIWSTTNQIPVRLSPSLKSEFENMCYWYGISLSEAARRMAKDYHREPYEMTRPKQQRKGATMQIKVGLPPHLHLEGWQVALLIEKWTDAEKKRVESYRATMFVPPDEEYTIQEVD